MFGIDLTTCLLFLLMYLCGWVLVQRWNTKRSRPFPLPPSPPFQLPVIGHLYLMSGDPCEKFRQWRQQYGNIFSVQLGCRLVVVISSHELLKEAFIKFGDFFSHRPHLDAQKYFKMPGPGVILASGETWKEQRKVTLDILRELGMGRNTLAVKIQEEVAEFLTQLGHENGQDFNPHDLVHFSVANVIGSIIFGERFEHGDRFFLRLITMFQENMRDFGGDTAILNFLPFLSRLPGDWFRLKRIDSNADELLGFMREKYKEHMRNFDENCVNDFISVYIREMKKKKASGEPTTVDENNLLQVVGDLFSAGMETTAMTICWTMVYFLHYPLVQEKCFQEIQNQVSAGRLPTLQDKLRLPYMEATIMEVQRKANVVPLAVHHTVVEDFVFHGHLIPKETIILPLLESVLMDPQTWGDPEVFRPERFLDDCGKCVRPTEFIPFSLGRRVCLGESLAKMELFLFLSAMVQRFHFLPPHDGALPSLQGILETTLSPQPFTVRVIPRT